VGFLAFRTHGLRRGLRSCAPSELGVLVLRWREDLGIAHPFAQFAEGWEFLLITTGLSFGGFACMTLAAVEELSKSGYAVFCLQGSEVRSKQARPTSPPDALGSFDQIEMAIATQQRESVLAAECGDPEIISRDRRLAAPQLQIDFGVVVGGRFVHIQDEAVLEQALEPAFVREPVARLRNPVTIFAQHDHGDRQLVGAGENGDQCGIVVGSG